MLLLPCPQLFTHLTVVQGHTLTSVPGSVPGGATDQSAPGAEAGAHLSVLWIQSVWLSEPA